MSGADDNDSPRAEIFSLAMFCPDAGEAITRAEAAPARVAAPATVMMSRRPKSFRLFRASDFVDMITPLGFYSTDCQAVVWK